MRRELGVACEGGARRLHIDPEIIGAVQDAGCELAGVTNGTLEAPVGIDWICMSPKAGADLVLKRGQELKLVFPQSGGEPERYHDLAFENFFLQPMDGPEKEQNIRLATRYCLAHPEWRLSLQTHKILGIR